MLNNDENQEKNTDQAENSIAKNWQIQLSPISIKLVPEHPSDAINSTMAGYNDTIKYEAELEKVKHELKKAQIAKRDMMQNIIYNLKIPCNGIFSLVTVLHEIEQDPEKKSYLSSVVNCAEELLNYYNNIVSRSLDNTGLPRIVFKKFNPEKLVRNIIAKAKPLAKQKGLNLSCNFQHELTNTVISDTYRIQAILEQLIDNSIEFTEKGNVVVTVNMFAISPALSEDEQNYREMALQFIVHDTGPGLPEKIKEYLYQQSYELDTPQYPGLSFVKRLIEELHGDLEVTSTEGKSTTIVYNIPVKLALLQGILYQDS